MELNKYPVSICLGGPVTNHCNVVVVLVPLKITKLWQETHMFPGTGVTDEDTASKWEQ